MESKIKDFRTKENMIQASNICSACATFIQIALGEVCSLNAMAQRAVFPDAEAKKILPAFKKVLDILHKSFKEYYNLASEFSQSDEKK